MSKDLLKALQELIVPVSTGWDIIDFKVEDKKEEVHIHLSYGANSYKEAGKKHSIYDYRPSRKWRHSRFVAIQDLHPCRNTKNYFR